MLTPEFDIGKGNRPAHRWPQKPCLLRLTRVQRLRPHTRVIPPTSSTTIHSLGLPFWEVTARILQAMPLGYTRHSQNPGGHPGLFSIRSASTHPLAARNLLLLPTFPSSGSECAPQDRAAHAPLVARPWHHHNWWTKLKLAGLPEAYRPAQLNFLPYGRQTPYPNTHLPSCHWRRMVQQRLDHYLVLRECALTCKALQPVFPLQQKPQLPA